MKEREIHETARLVRLVPRERRWVSRSEQHLLSDEKRWGVLERRSWWVRKCWSRNSNCCGERSLGLGKTAESGGVGGGGGDGDDTVGSI